MLVLKIIAGILILGIVIFSLVKLNQKYENQFGFKVFSIPLIVSEVIGVALGLGGYLWYSDSLKTNGDTLNGIVLMAIGFLIILSIVFIIYKNTNLIYGTLGTLILIARIAIISIAMPLLIMFLVMAIVAIFFSDTKNVRIVN